MEQISIQKTNSLSALVYSEKIFILHWTKALMNPLKNIFFVFEKNISKKSK